MPKENRFAGLGDAIDDEAEGVQQETAASESADTADAERERSDESEEATEESSENAVSRVDETQQEHEEDEESGLERKEDEQNEPEREAEKEDEPEGSAPAFEFEATTAKSIYVRRATLDQLDDAEFEVESLLRREHDIRNLTGREFHDALVRIATDHPGDIVDAILETRDE